MNPKSTYKIEFSYKNIFFILAILLGAVLLWKVKIIVVIFFVAFILNSTFRPLIDKLEKHRIPRVISVSTLYLIIAIVLISVVSAIFFQTTSQTFDLFDQSQTELINLLYGENGQWIIELLNSNGTENEILEILKQANISGLGTFFGGGVLGAINIINNTFAFVIEIATTVVISIYMLTRKTDVYKSLLEVFPLKQKTRFENLLKQIEHNLGNWLRGQMILMIMVGFLTWIVLVVPSLFLDNYTLHEYALLIAFLAALLEAIPNIGPIMTTIAAIIIALITNFTAPLFSIAYILVAFLAIQQIESQLLTPKIMQRAVGLDPIIIILSIIGALILFGVVGALLVIPLLAIVKIVIESEYGLNATNTPESH